MVLVQVWCIYWFVCFFLMPVQVLVILDCVCFGSWPYFKLMFQRSKHETADKTLQNINDKRDMYLLLEL